MEQTDDLMKQQAELMEKKMKELFQKYGNRRPVIKSMGRDYAYERRMRQYPQEEPEVRYKQMLGDDDPLDNLSGSQLVKEKSEIQKFENYNFDENLDLTVQTQNKYFQFNSSQDQTIPVIVSLKTIESVSDESKVESESVDQPIDLVCVIDNSYSMEGQKLRNVKRALTYLLKLLKDNDRICLILFNSNAIQLCRLMRVNDLNRSSIEELIKQIQATGGTNINSGMNLALSVLKKRKQQNQVTSIFLLSDGQDSSATKKVIDSIQEYQLRESCFTINTFGFGDDHDAKTMIDICNLKDGSFYYIQDIDSIDEFFCDAIGGLFSVVAKEIEIEVKLNFKKEQEKYFKNTTVQKLYGNQWRKLKTDQLYIIRFNKLISGVQKDFIFELNIPAQQVESIEDHDRNVEVIDVSVNLTPVNHECITKYSKSSKLILTLYQENEAIPIDSELNKEVEFNYMRVKCSEAMEKAIYLQQRNDHYQAQQLVKSMIQQISGSTIHTQQKLKQTQTELELLGKELKSNQGISQNTKTSIYSSINACYTQSGGHELGKFSNKTQLKFIHGSLDYKESSAMSSKIKPISEQSNETTIKETQVRLQDSSTENSQQDHSQQKQTNDTEVKQLFSLF